MKSFPLILVLLIYILGFLPDFFSFIPNMPDFIVGGFPVGMGLLAADLIYLIMTISVFYRVFHEHGIKKDLGLRNVLLIFSAFILFEILRNVNEYGLSAPGEFRFYYFYLIIPAYIAIYFDNAVDRKKLAKLLIGISIFIPILSVPIIGMYKGWSFGSEDRFLNSATYLGIAYGYTLLLLSCKYKIMQVSKRSLILLALLLIFMTLIDGHRSAWLAILVIIVSLIYLKEISRKYLTVIIIIGFIGLIITALVVKNYGMDLRAYLATRSIAFFNPEMDDTSAWRILQWQAQIEKIINSPLLGEGFGGFFRVYIPGLGESSVSPHSYYVQSLVKLGIVGLLLYLLIVKKILSKILLWLKHQKGNPEYPLVLIGIPVLIAAHFYYFVYSLEFMTMFFVGLSLAVVQHSPDAESQIKI
ncbi:MAG: O-antigen ligase family protein [Bacteroidota bacterium]